MSLFFLHPIYLYGLIAASLPALIHLLNRRRLKRIRFPAVRFVLLSQRRISRSVRLRHWVLLALRTFAVILLVLLLANPIFQTGIGLFAGGGPLSLAVILDNSLSMQWSRGGEGFRQAKRTLHRLISSLRDGDQIALIPTNRSKSSPSRPRAQKELLLRDLENIQISDGTADYASALSKAYELLRHPAAQKNIWLITDMALTGWDRFIPTTLEVYDPLISLKIIKLGREGEPENATIKDIKLRGQEVGVGLPIHLEASIINFTDKAIKNLLVHLNIDEQTKDRKLVPRLPPKGELGVSFQFTVTQPGDHRGTITIKKEGLAGNATAYFTLHARKKLKILVVDGDPQTSLVQSETFFLTRALNPAGVQASSLFLPTVIIPEGLSSEPLDAYQALILCNVPAIPRAALPRLKSYLYQGGGVLLTVGDRIQMDDYNLKLFQSSPPILPGPLNGKTIFSQPREEKIGTVNLVHPALRGFDNSMLQASLKSTRIRGYFRTTIPDKSALLTLSNGDPLLMERKVGSGRLLLLTTAADRDWSDLPLKTAYLPLIQSLVSYLAGGQRGTMDPGITVGNKKTFSLPASYVGKSVRIVDPGHKEREIALVPTGKNLSATFQKNEFAGIYQLLLPVKSSEQMTTSQIYAVNSPFLESRLETIGERELRAKLKPIHTEIISIGSLEKGGKRRDLSLPLLAFLIVTLASEGWLSQRIHE
ncbi:MAG: BatA domain-containing protein [Candidatus Binatia bacterium]